MRERERENLVILLTARSAHTQFFKEQSECVTWIACLNKFFAISAHDIHTVIRILSAHPYLANQARTNIQLLMWFL